MKAIVCEMCSSHDIVKKDGMYICESCGTKYTAEEAKKMMVDISGSTVKIDTSDKLKNMYEVARRAKNENNSETAAKYYDMILMEDPSSWEATFYSSYFTAMQTKIMNISSAAYKVKNSAVTAIQMIKDNVEDPAEQDEALTQIVVSTTTIGVMLHSSAKNHHSGTTFKDVNYQQKHDQEYIDRAAAVTDMLYATGDQIEKLFTSEKALKLAALCWEQGVEVNKAYLYLLNKASKENNWTLINRYVDKAIRYDSSYADKKTRERMAAIDSQIAKINVKYRKRNGYFAIALAVISIIIRICSIAIGGSVLLYTFERLCFIAAVVLAITGIRSPKNQEEQKKKIAELQKQKEELENQLKK